MGFPPIMENVLKVGKEEVVRMFSLEKKPRPIEVGLKIDFDVMGIGFPASLPHDEWLSDLPRALDDEDLFPRAAKIILDEGCDFSFEHKTLISLLSKKA